MSHCPTKGSPQVKLGHSPPVLLCSTLYIPPLKQQPGFLSFNFAYVLPFRTGSTSCHLCIFPVRRCPSGCRESGLSGVSCQKSVAWPKLFSYFFAWTCYSSFSSNWSGVSASLGWALYVAKLALVLSPVWAVKLFAQQGAQRANGEALSSVLGSLFNLKADFPPPPPP